MVAKSHTSNPFIEKREASRCPSIRRWFALDGSLLATSPLPSWWVQGSEPRSGVSRFQVS